MLLTVREPGRTQPRSTDRPGPKLDFAAAGPSELSGYTVSFGSLYWATNECLSGRLQKESRKGRNKRANIAKISFLPLIVL